MLLDSDLSPEQRHYAEVVDASAKSLLQLINDILDFSKIEAGKLEIDTLDFNLRSLVDDFAHVMAGTRRREAVGIHLRRGARCPRASAGTIRGACARCW